MIFTTYGDQVISSGFKKTCSQACACDPYDLYGDIAKVAATITCGTWDIIWSPEVEECFKIRLGLYDTIYLTDSSL